MIPFANKHGYYQLEDKITYSKLEALEWQKLTGKWPEWNFNREVFECYDWTVMPDYDLSGHYMMRAKQIREKYDYCVLFYSGGSDSHNMLNAWIKQGLKIDEIASFWNLEGTKDPQSFMCAEIQNVVLPDIDTLKAKGIEFEFRLIDICQMTVDYIAKHKFDYGYYSNHSISPNNVIKGTFRESIVDYKKLIDSGKIGEVQYIESTRQNWGRFQTRISTLLSLAPHDVSIIHYLLGYEPFTDIAYKGINLSEKTQNDIDTYQFKCKGVDIKFNLSWYHPAKIRTMSIIGTKGMIYWDEEAHSLVHYDKLWENDRMNYDTINHPHRYNIQTNPLRNQLKDFVHCIEDSSQPLSNVDVAIEVASNLDLLNQYSS